MGKDKIEVALVHELCLVCGKEMNEQIIMNQRLSPREAEEVKSMHKKAIGYSDEPCDECSDYMTKGYILIEYDERLTTDKSNPYRTGHLWVITFEAAERMNMDEATFKNGFAMIDIDTAKKIGLHKHKE